MSFYTLECFWYQGQPHASGATVQLFENGAINGDSLVVATELVTTGVSQAVQCGAVEAACPTNIKSTNSTLYKSNSNWVIHNICKSQGQLISWGLVANQTLVDCMEEFCPTQSPNQTPIQSPIQPSFYDEDSGDTSTNYYLIVVLVGIALIYICIVLLHFDEVKKEKLKKRGR